MSGVTHGKTQEASVVRLFYVFLLHLLTSSNKTCLKCMAFCGFCEHDIPPRDIVTSNPCHTMGASLQGSNSVQKKLQITDGRSVQSLATL